MNGLGDVRLDLLFVSGIRPSRCLLWDRFRVGRFILDGVNSAEIESEESEERWCGLKRVEGRSFMMPLDRRGEESELDAAPASVKSDEAGEDVSGSVIVDPEPRFKSLSSFSSFLISARTSSSAASRPSTVSSIEARRTL